MAVLAKLVQISPSGVGILRDEAAQRDLAFTFDKIEGYRGEQPGEIGLTPGRKVKYTEQNGIVQRVKLD